MNVRSQRREKREKLEGEKSEIDSLIVYKTKVWKQI